MKKLLTLLIILSPVIAVAQYSGLKFSSTTLSVTVTPGQYVNLQQIKVLKTDGSAAPSTMVNYQVNPAAAMAGITGIPQGGTMPAGPDGGVNGFVANQAGTFSVTLSIGGIRGSALVNVTVNNSPTNPGPSVYRIERAGAVSQTAFVNSGFLENCRVRVYSNNAPAAFTSVVFTIAGTGASGEFPNLAGGGPKFANTMTDQDGYASAPQIKANGSTGTFYVTATSNNQTIKFSLTNAAAN